MEDPEKELIVQDDAHLAHARSTETGVVFGRSSLPVLERLDYEVSLRTHVRQQICTDPSTSRISLPYPNSTDPAPEPLPLRFEGTHVLNGLRSAAEKGFADDVFSVWIWRVVQERGNALKVGEYVTVKVSPMPTACSFDDVG